MPSLPRDPGAEAASGAKDPGLILSADEYARYLADYAARLADERSARRENTYRALFGVVIAAIAFLGYSNLQNLKEDIATVVGAKIESEIASQVMSEYTRQKSVLVQETIGQINKDVDAKLAFIQLRISAAELERKSGFSPAERDAVVSLLRQASQSEKIRESAEFRVELERILDSFVAASLDEDVDELDNSLSVETLKSRGIVTSLAIHYGTRVCGDADLRPTTIERFDRYAAAAQRHGMPDLALLYQIGLKFRQTNQASDAAIDRMLMDVEALSLKQRMRFLKTLANNVDDGGQSDSTGRLRREGALYRELAKRYATQLARIEESVKRDQAESGQADQSDEGESGGENPDGGAPAHAPDPESQPSA